MIQKQYFNKLFFMIVLLTLHGCDSNAGNLANISQKTIANGLMLVFEESDKEQPPYISRMIITDDYLRLDNGELTDDFVLLDRKKQIIYSTNSDDRTILTINYKKRDVTEPVKIAIRVETGLMPDAPKVGGAEIVHHSISVNNAPCYDVVSAKDLLAEAVQAMREYRTILASEHKRVLHLVPPELHESCDLAYNVFHPVLSLSFGLPLQEWNRFGYQRNLKDFNDHYYAEPALFILPESYVSYSMNEVP